MKHSIVTLIAFALLPLGGNACEVRLPGLPAALQIPAAIQADKKSQFKTPLSGTECKTFAQKKGKSRAGVLCSSTNTEFLGDSGVSKSLDDASATSESTPNAIYQVATGISMYPMEASTSNGVTIHTADVDCDEANEAIYRPTATCNVTVAFLGDGRFFYGKFVLEDNIEGTKRVDKKDVLELWNNLTRSISTKSKPPIPAVKEKRR